jgi:hypothetical protein
MNFIPIVLPIAAFIISVLSLILTLRNNKRQIRIAKLEELLEINLFLLYHYEVLLDIFEIQNKIRQPTQERTGMETMSLQENENQQIQAFFETVGQNIYLHKLMRLEVLARSFLPNIEVKYQILSLADMYTHLSLATLYKDYDNTKMAFEKYPEVTKLFEYSEVIEIEIIKEMNLGYGSLKAEDIEQYRGKLKTDLKIL